MKVKNTYVIDYRGRVVPVYELENGKWYVGNYNFAGQLHITEMHPASAKQMLGIKEDIDDLL